MDFWNIFYFTVVCCCCFCFVCCFVVVSTFYILHAGWGFGSYRRAIQVRYMPLVIGASGHHLVRQPYLYTCWRIVYLSVQAGSPSCGGDVVDYVKDINQPSLPTLFYSVLVSISVFMALSTVFYSINSPDNFPLSHSVLPVLFLPCWSFQLYISLWKCPSALI